MQINQNLDGIIMSHKIDSAFHGFLRNKPVGLPFYVFEFISYFTPYLVREHVNGIMNLAFKRRLNEIK